VNPLDQERAGVDVVRVAHHEPVGVAARMRSRIGGSFDGAV
jgi:hypothetical protein